MHFRPSFYRFAAICSFVSAVTTLGLIFLPGWFAPAEDFAARMARVDDPVYRVYAWVYLAHFAARAIPTRREQLVPPDPAMSVR